MALEGEERPAGNLVDSASMNRIRQSKRLGRLLQALLALAVMFAPMTANAMETPSARAAGVEQRQAGPAGHCSGDQDSGSQPGKALGKNCCAAMCVGIAAIAPPPIAESIVIQAVPRSFAPTFLFGSPGELPTPPPRSA